MQGSLIIQILHEKSLLFTGYQFSLQVRNIPVDNQIFMYESFTAVVQSMDLSLYVTGYIQS